MHPRHLVLIASLAAPAALAAQGSGAFVVRLGNDTLSLEQYTRTATQLRGEYVIRSPRSVHRIYTADLNPDGTIRRLELITHNISGGPGPMETKSSVEFVGDTAVVVSPRGDSTVTQRLAVPRGTMPFTLHIYGLFEQIARQARASGKDSVAITALAGANAPSGGVVRKRGGDTLTLAFTQGQLAGLGPFTFRLDPQGRLVWLTGRGSTVQVDVERVASVPMATAGPMFATRPLGPLSVRDTARAQIPGTEIWVDYGRPLKRGRVIFGNVVPWNTVWRTGANAATQFSTSVDLVMGGVTIPAGKYTLWSLPSPTGWTLIVNKQTGQWGTEYHAEQDLARVNLGEEKLPQPLEQFTITIEPEATGGVIRFAWDDRRGSIPFTKKSSAAQDIPETGAFIVRLGTDTLVVERFTRAGNRLEGRHLSRSPQTMLRDYAATLRADGTVEHLEMTLHRLGAATLAEPSVQRFSVVFRGDSAILETLLGEGVSTRVVRLAVPPATLPYLGNSWALLEQATRRLRASGADRIVQTVLSVAADDTMTVELERRGTDSATVTIFAGAPNAARVDAAGRILGVRGTGDLTVERVTAVDLAALTAAFARRPLGPLSPADSTAATVAGATVTVKYARPAMRGRRIFGHIVPWDRVWRTGANEATLFATTADLVMGGTTIPAGTYTLWTIPAPNGWQLIINKNTGQWGTDYRAAHDLARLAMAVQTLARPVERFTIAVEPRGAGGVLRLEWEQTRASVEFRRR